MKQTTNSILMIRPVAFRMNEQTAVNNYYQKVLDGLTPENVNAKAQEEFDVMATIIIPSRFICWRISGESAMPPGVKMTIPTVSSSRSSLLHRAITSSSSRFGIERKISNVPRLSSVLSPIGIRP